MLLAGKDNTFAAYQNYTAWAKMQYSVDIKQLHSDCGGKYLDYEFCDYLKAHGTE